MTVKKVCAVVIRRKGARREILVFRHPNGDIQFVKGNIKTGETFKAAAIRELREESGLKSIFSSKLLGSWNSKHRNQIWYFYRCKVGKKLKNSWDFYTNDGGGQTFSFFWFDLNKSPGKDWRPIFKRALKSIKKRL